MPFENKVKSKDTPFVYFVSGTPVYPPNAVYESARIALDAATDKPIRETLKDLAKSGDVAGIWSVPPEAWWYHIFRSYLGYFANNLSAAEEMERSAVEALKLMIRIPPKDAWADLVAYITREVDTLSGWTKCWIKHSAEERNIFKGEDGSYYCRELDGTLIQIIGMKTTPETRLDFITDQILSNYGCLRQIFNVFSVFAIAYEFGRDPQQFPRSMKAVLVDPEFNNTSHRWQLMQFERTRSVKWRPLSNVCDPEWLAGDLLARITDTLDRNLWQERVERHKDRPNCLDEDCRWQLDYVLNSNVAIGGDEEIYFPFEGRTFRWINGTPETKAIISVGVKELNDHREEDESLNRLLSVLVWEHRHPIAKESGVGGMRRPIPLVWGPRMSFGLRVDPRYLFRETRDYSEDRWLALALFKEGVNSQSVFYKFLNFWKIVERAIKDGKNTRWAWINKKVTELGLHRERIDEIMKRNPNIAEYLDYSCRCAIAHVFSDPIINPDDHDDYVRISQDVIVVQDLARAAVEEFLA